MALLTAGWLLLILLVNTPKDFAAAGPPDRDFQPKCYIPCEDNNCWELHIHCDWGHAFEPQVPVKYSLHWQTAHSDEGNVTTGASLNGVINRVHFFMNSKLRVWVQAESQQGSAKSLEVVFNTGHIMKPARPKIVWSQQDPLEISWNSACNEPHLSLGSCDVRYCTEVDKTWIEEKIGANVNYEFYGEVQPAVFYEFQVRCSCATGLMSDWSASHRIKSLEAAPTGEMDVWEDCGVPATNIVCVITWKMLPISQAHGHILGYEWTLSKHGNDEFFNVSTAEPMGWLVCHEMQCYLNLSLKNVTSVNISAYNAQGSTEPSYLALPTTERTPKHAIDVTINTENLTVLWDLRSQRPDINSIKEYVVQYKQAGRHLGQGFDWMRVNKSHGTATFRGHFEKYTPYQVSLFKVTPNGQSQHFSSVIGYSHQGTPSKGPSFKISSIAATRVTLVWEPVPLAMQRGLILYYQIGIQGQMAVYNVTNSPQDTSETFELRDLNPDQEYEVWIKAVTEAGPGPEVMARFKTEQEEQLKSQRFILTLLLPVCFLIILGGILVSLSFCRGAGKVCVCLNERIPDAYNSGIFKLMKEQMDDQLVWISNDICEPHPTISVLEVVAIKEPACGEYSDSEDLNTKPATKSKQRDGKDYSKRVDSDQEKGASELVNREDSWNSDEEDDVTLGYEKHFMPTTVEMLES
ncbi:leukemia inhibitory factor receptor-like isoform X1 [Entelurus aequoreus]|uniref:leukemia inhibitory factor receptor-like isoform X1 n=1 Tax=Entelurus aequoreus TaxID=161455 RepID=UPI002B1E23A5|nr:leukemia inhibitory factor receptor-like isoform X1 [Entelurus aequoreus]XP_061892508.1 leukemia inhibitory factor receptor-like isoform X1 [Entelurus aequoreus]